MRRERNGKRTVRLVVLSALVGLCQSPWLTARHRIGGGLFDS